MNNYTQCFPLRRHHESPMFFAVPIYREYDHKPCTRSKHVPVARKHCSLGIMLCESKGTVQNHTSKQHNVYNQARSCFCAPVHKHAVQPVAARLLQGSWCQVPHACWFALSGWSLMPGAPRLVTTAWFLVPGAWRLDLGV